MIDFAMPKTKYNEVYTDHIFSVSCLLCSSPFALYMSLLHKILASQPNLSYQIM